MIYIYKAEALANLRNRAFASYNEYNILSLLKNPPHSKAAGLPGIFYYYMHEIYDPLFLWNITEINQLRIELGNNRFVGRAIRAQQTSEERWLSTLLISPDPWNHVLADLRIISLDKTVNIDFPSAERFNSDTDSIIVEGKFFNEVVRPYLKFPQIFDKVFGRNDNSTHAKYIDDNLSYSYILKNKDTMINILGNKNNPVANEYDINDYGGVMNTVSAMFMDAEKEIK
jgi:hypothetical protein